MYKFLPVVLGAAILAGCHGSAHLQATPSSVSQCDGASHPHTVEVSWDAIKATKGGRVKLWAHNYDAFSNGKPTLWTEQGPKGSAVTGRWIVPGTEITLTNASNGDVLAEITIGSIPCKK